MFFIATAGVVSVIAIVVLGLVAEARKSRRAVPPLAARNSRLADCPESPNCVCSQAVDPVHAIAPLDWNGSQADAMAKLKSVVAQMPRCTIVEESPDYLRIECRSALFGFVDDLEFLVQDPPERIDVRSASRVGYGDLGVNRLRVTRVREALRGE